MKNSIINNNNNSNLPTGSRVRVDLSQQDIMGNTGDVMGMTGMEEEPHTIQPKATLTVVSTD